MATEAPAAPAPAAAKPTAVPGAAPRPAAAVKEVPAASGKMQPPANVRPKGSPPATGDMKNRMAKFFTEPGKEKDGPALAKPAGQLQQERTRPAVQARPPEKGNGGDTPPLQKKEPVPKELTAESREKTEQQQQATEKADLATDGTEGTEAAEKKAGYLTDAEVAQKKSGELGRHYKNLKRENIGLKAQLTKSREAADKNPEVGKLTETLKQREERLAAVEQELRYTNFEASDEFKEKYWAPYQKAYEEGRELTTELLVREVKDELGEVKQAGRAGTAADFDRIVGEENTARAAQMAQELFGEVQGAEIMRARREVRKLNTVKEEAKEKYKKEGGEIFKKRQEQQQAHQAAMSKAFRDGITNGRKKHAEWFEAAEGDAELGDAIAKGEAFVESCFSGRVKNDDGTERALTAAELAGRQAGMYNQARAFGKVVLEKHRLLEENKALKEKLKEFEASAPGEGDAPADAKLGQEEPDRGPKNTARSIAGRMSKYLT